METVIGLLNLVLWAVVVLMFLYYLILSIYISSPVSSAMKKGIQGTDKLTAEQQISWIKSHLASMQASLLTQSTLAVSIATALIFLGYQWLAVLCALLSGWKLFDYRTMKTAETKRKDLGVHNNGLVRCLSVIPVRDVDMNEVDKEIDKQLFEMEKMRR